MAEAAPTGEGGDLRDVLKPERILCHARLSSKKQLLQALAELLSADLPGMAPSAVLNSLVERERVSNTGLGNGVALPHGRMGNLDQPLAAFIHLSRGIDYDAPDGKQVDLVLAMAVPEATGGHQLECLSRLGELLRDVQFSARLRHQVRAEQFYALLTDAA